MKSLKTGGLVLKALLITLILAVAYAIAQVSGMPDPQSVPLTLAVVGTPSTLAQLNATGIRNIAWDRKLRETKVLPSIFTALQSELKVVGNKIELEKSGILMRVDPKLAASGQSVRLAMGRNFRKAPQIGTEQHSLGNEDEGSLLWTELFYNEVKKAYKYFKYGYNHNDTEYLGWVESLGPRFALFWDELFDLRVQQAVCLGRAMELTVAPLNLPVTLNPNWVIPNLDDALNPTWDNTAITVVDGAADADGYYSARTYSGATAFAENVAARMLQGSGTGASGKALLNVDMFVYISEYIVQVLKLNPLMLDGLPTYVLAVPSRVKAWCLNPNKAGSLGEAFQEYHAYASSDRIKLPGEFGRILSNLILVENWRSPTVKVGGEVGSYTLNFGFYCPGENDDRHAGNWSNTPGSENYVFDVVEVLGAEAVAQYLKDPLTTKLFEDTEYGQIQGRGGYLGEGLQLPLWDKDAAARVDGDFNTRSLIYRGSALIPVSRTPRIVPV